MTFSFSPLLPGPGKLLVSLVPELGRGPAGLGVVRLRALVADPGVDPAPHLGDLGDALQGREREEKDRQELVKVKKGLGVNLELRSYR